MSLPIFGKRLYVAVFYNDFVIKVLILVVIYNDFNIQVLIMLVFTKILLSKN